MYDRNKTTIIDRREMLRVKIKSLAAEIRIIHFEERRTFGQIQQELYRHRVFDLKSAARSTNIALALIRGRTIKQIEATSKSDPDWPEVNRMLKKYGPAGMPSYPFLPEDDAVKQEAQATAEKAAA